jgi:tetratricopeptide (TPR) repeat protein
MSHSRCVPPVPAKVRVSQSGPLPYLYVLAEFDALRLEREGLEIWQALRRLREWLGSPPEGPGGRNGGAEGRFEAVDAGLRPSLRVLDRLLAEPDPGGDTQEAVALACFHAALWTEERGAYRTAVGLLHAAEDVYPDNAHYAYNLGRVARKMALYEDAEAWLKWAHFVARSSADWEVATLALSGLGNLHRQRGGLPTARRFHEAARRLARLKGLRTLEGDALYDLAVMAFYVDDSPQAITYARQALAAYGPGHTQVYHLAHDIAWYWMDALGDFQNAAHVFSALLDHVWQPSIRLLVTANLARAVAGLGWKEPFERSWIDVWVAVRQGIDRQGHAAALTQLALGAGTLGDWDRANLAADEALKVARNRMEEPVILIAEGILDSLRQDVISDEALRAVFKDLARANGSSEAAADLAVEFEHAMRARRDGAPESPTRALVAPAEPV